VPSGKCLTFDYPREEESGMVQDKPIHCKPATGREKGEGKRYHSVWRWIPRATKDW